MKTKTLRITAVALAMAISVSGFIPVQPDASAAVKKPSLNAKKGNQLIGTTKTVSIKNVSKKTVRKLTVKSANRSVATVKKAGAGKKTAFKVTAKKTGKTTITASIILNNKKKYKLTYILTAKKVITKKIPIFQGKDTDKKAEIKYFAGTPHIAYMEVDAYSKLFSPSAYVRKEVSPSDKNVYTLTNSGGTAVVDVAKDTFYSEDYTEFATNCLSESGETHESMVDSYEYDKVYDDYNTDSRVPVTFDFASYHIDLKADGDRVFFPVSTLGDMYGGASRGMFPLSVFTGKKLYVFDFDNQGKPDELDREDYADAVLDLLMHQKDWKDLREYNYYELAFVIDHFFANIREKSLLYSMLKKTGSLDQSLEQYEYDGVVSGPMIKESLLSEDVGEYLLGYSALNNLLFDGGHTGFDPQVPEIEGDKRCKSIINAWISAAKQHPDLQRADWRQTAWNRDIENGFIARKKMRNDLLGLDPEKADHPVDKSKYVEKGDTAICVLDTFYATSDNLLNDYVTKPAGDRSLPEITEKEYDPIVQFLDALEKADKNPAIKNFVLDISNNGGGFVHITESIGALMTEKNTFQSMIVNLLTGDKITETLTLDKNFDGVFDAQDELVDYAKRFHFAVLTSWNSFSGANMLASFAKRNGIPVLGERSGGGACFVKYLYAPNGLFYNISSACGCYVDETGVSIDGGIPVDIDLSIRNDDGSMKMSEVEIADHFTGESTVVQMMDYSQFYDLDRLSKEIHAWYRDPICSEK